MSHSIALVAKGVMIAFLAAGASWAYLFGLTLYQGHGIEWALGEASLGSFLVSLVGTFAIGLPIALFAYRFSGPQMARSFTTLAMVAVLSGIMLVLASFVVADSAGVLVLGIPAFIAALTFGVLGWFWILRPMRRQDGA